MTDGSAVSYLVSAYLNEDVFDFHPDVLGAVDDFVRRDPAMVETLKIEIDQVLATRSDDEIDELLTECGVGFLPGQIGYRGWLRRIAGRLEQVAPAAQRGH